MDPEQREAFREAVRRKSESSRERSMSHHPAQEDQSDDTVNPAAEQDLFAANRPQDTLDPRAKNAGKGKTTADKWNQ